MVCPECFSEYRDGFTRCKECGVVLINDLPDSTLDLPVDDEPAIVFVTSDATEAVLVKGLLEASGVDAYLLDEHLSRLHAPVSILIGGVKIAVPRQEESLALEVLAEFRGRAGQDPTHGHVNAFMTPTEYEPYDREFPADTGEMRCPHCRTPLEPETTNCENCGRQPW
jgi:hypothetical protein